MTNKDKKDNGVKKAGKPAIPERVAIVGLGPVGMTLAVHLQEAGCRVAICDMDRLKINKIRKEGIRLVNVIQKTAWFEDIFTGIADLKSFDPDLLIFSLKSYQMASALAEAGELVSDKLHVISAQNGIDIEWLPAEVFGESHTLRMVINYAGNLNEPNEVKVTFFNPPNYIASIDDSCTSLAESYAAALNSVGLTTEVLDSFGIIRRSWEKTILNASLSALCGIGKLTIREAMEMPDTMEIVEQVIHEAVEVAEAEKIRFPDDFIRKCMRYLKKAGDHFPSLAVDLINNRPTEIDYLNGKIVAYGRKHYIRTSLNLVFTNMIKAMTHKKLMAYMPGKIAGPDTRPAGIVVGDKGKLQVSGSGPWFMGVDLGSAYTKFTVINRNGEVAFRTTLKTLNREKIAVRHVVEALHGEFDIAMSCATGYGRKHFHEAELIKTEINCAAKGVQHFVPGAKNIIDIGGEDIKVIHCDENGAVENFYLNDKCSAGTGSFLTEIAERADIRISEMSDLAAKSQFDSELNSFCTVFAKTEIMGWLFDGKSVEDIARGIYLSIANRVFKLRVDPQKPVIMIGGVIDHHPYLAKLLEPRYGQSISTLENPQHTVSFGAALYALEQWENQQKAKEEAIPEAKKQ